MNPQEAEKQTDADRLARSGLRALMEDRFDEALTLADQAIFLGNHDFVALETRAAALSRLKRPAEALLAYEALCARFPQSAEAWFNLGNTLRQCERLPEAVRAFGRCLDLNPGYVDAYQNIGATLHWLGDFAGAIAAYDVLLALRPDDARALTYRGHARLMIGEFESGWQDYEHRWGVEPYKSAWIDRGCPQWDGTQPIEGKTLLIHAEQGLGDTIQFCRYAPLVQALGASVVFEVQPALVHLLQSLQGAGLVVPKGLQLPVYDFHVPLLSLPRVFKTDANHIPGQSAYLHASADRVRRWSSEIKRDGLNVGICWEGSQSGRDVGRDTPLSQFLRLGVVPGVNLYSLQRHAVHDRLSDVSVQTHVHEFDASFDEWSPFMDTAAVISQLDLVITVDTSVAHLAGALGAPTWVLLPHICDWRWGLATSHTPWYPTMRLFRRRADEDWVECFDRVVGALLEFAQQSDRATVSPGCAVV